MIGLLKSRMEDVYDVVLVANTPAYLYKNLRRVLFDVAHMIPFQTLVSELRKEAAPSPNDECDQASYIYALFVLMTYGQYEDVRPHLGWIKSGKAEWINHLANHYQRNVLQITSISNTIHLPSLIEKRDVVGGQSSHDITTTIIDLK